MLKLFTIYCKHLFLPKLILHNCGICRIYMKVNGYGLCEECLYVIKYENKEDIHERVCYNKKPNINLV